MCFVSVFSPYLFIRCPSLQPREILERLNAGEVVIGDGGFLHALEKRGYLKAGVYTPECTVEHPDAGEYICPSLRPHPRGPAGKGPRQYKQ